jgi:hypothetical protein
VADHQAKGDTGFAEALELMGFLTTLLGSEHVQRFIPLAATAPASQPGTPVATAKTPVRQAKPPAAPAKPARAPKPDKTATTVIADAARLLSWGREWPQLASLIARLADRPPEQEVWAILRTHRAAIQAKARSVPD